MEKDNNENRILVFEGFVPALTKECIWSVFKELGIKYITLNSQKLSCHLFFQTEKHAQIAISQMFGKPLLKKPMILSFKLAKEAKNIDFNISGLNTTTIDMNTLYNTCSKFGKYCKLKLNIQQGSSKPQSYGYLSYSQISPSQKTSLEDTLKQYQIKIQPLTFIHNQITVRIKFPIKDKCQNKQQKQFIFKENEQKIKLALKQLNVNESDYKLTLQGQISSNEQFMFTIYVMFNKQDIGKQFIAKLKTNKEKYFVPEAEIHMKNNEVKSKNQTFAHIFSKNIVKPQKNQSKESLEKQYYQALKSKFPEITQVVLRPMKKIKHYWMDSFLAFITFDKQENGKQLILASVKGSLTQLSKFYLGGKVNFDIFKSQDQNKPLKPMRSKKPQYMSNYRSTPYLPNPMMRYHNNRMAQDIKRTRKQSTSSQQMDIQQTRDQLLQNQQHYMQNPQQGKKMMFGVIKNDLQYLKFNPKQAIKLSNQIIHNSKIKLLYDYIINEEKLQNRAKHVQRQNRNKW